MRNKIIIALLCTFISSSSQAGFLETPEETARRERNEKRIADAIVPCMPCYIAFIFAIMWGGPAYILYWKLSEAYETLKFNLHKMFETSTEL